MDIEKDIMPDASALQSLLDMGLDETRCVQALKQAQNDVQRAISILFDSNYEITEDPMQEEPIASPICEENSEKSFPSADFNDIKRTLAIVNGTLCHKPNENISRCLKAAITMAENRETEEDPECVEFLNETLFVCFDKLLTAASNTIILAYEIFDNLYYLYHDLVKLIAIRLSYLPIPYRLLHCLEMVLDKNSVIHQRNKSDRPLDIPADFSYDNVERYPYGWLVSLLYKFSCSNGFGNLKLLFENKDLLPSDLAHLLKPFVSSFTLLHPCIYAGFFATGMDSVKSFFNALGGKDAKERIYMTVISDLIHITRRIYNIQDPEALHENSEICLTVVLKLLQSGFFSVKVLGLKELFSLIDESESDQLSEITPLRLSRWLIENNVLKTLLENHIDQPAYVSKLKVLLEFLSSRLTKDDIEMIWLIQDGDNIDMVTNIQELFLEAAHKFNVEQLNWILEFAIRSYVNGTDNRRRDKLLSFLGSLGAPHFRAASTHDILKCLHYLMNIDFNDKCLVDRAIHEHVNVLKNIFYKEKVCKSFIEQCVENISEGHKPTIAIKLLNAICHYILYMDQLENMTSLKNLLSLLILSIQSLHKKAVEAAKPNKLDSHVEVEIYTHGECLITHLSFLHIIVKEDKQSFAWTEVQTLWEILFVSPDACSFDRKHVMCWFKDNLINLDEQIRDQFYKEMVLKMDPSNMILPGYELYQSCIGHRYNISQHKRFGNFYPILERIEKSEIEFLWSIILYSLEEDITETAIKTLLDVYYCDIPQYIKWSHDQFAQECQNQLKLVVDSTEDALMVTIDKITSSLSSISFKSQEVADPVVNQKVQIIYRILQIVERYISYIDGRFQSKRTILPHGSPNFLYPIPIEIGIDNEKTSFSLVINNNETLAEVRDRATQYLGLQPNTINLFFNNPFLNAASDATKMSQFTSRNLRITAKRTLDTFSNKAVLIPTPPSTSFNFICKQPTSIHLDFTEKENMLPGVIFSEPERQIFDMLFHLSKIKSLKIRHHIRAILQLLPTNPKVLDVFSKLLPSSKTAAETQQDSEDETKLMILKELFYEDKSLQMLYNIEILCKLCIPTSEDPVSISASLEFCNELVRLKGHELMLNILTVEMKEADDELILNIYITVLLLFRHLLCGLHQPYYVNTSKLPEGYPQAIKTLSDDLLHKTINCLMRLSWAPAYNKPKLVTNPIPYTMFVNNLLSTTMASNISETGPLSTLMGLIGHRALDCLLSCMELRSSAFDIFHKLQSVNKFVIELLVVTANRGLRHCAFSHFGRFNYIKYPESQRFLNKIIFNSRQPFWVSSTTTRLSTQRLISQSDSYFRLLSIQLEKTSNQELVEINIDVEERLVGEVDFLLNFTLSTNTEQLEKDEALVMSHIYLITSMFNVDYSFNYLIAIKLIDLLLNKYLFPAAKYLVNSHATLTNSTFLPQCHNAETRKAGYTLLNMLASYHPMCFIQLAKSLVYLNHQLMPELTYQYEFEPMILSKQPNTCVGLKNGTATCYMNSVLQQLFMQSGIKEAIFGIKIEENSGVLSAVQLTFGHLLFSLRQYYVPKMLWDTFRFFNEPVNITEQQDAFDFYLNLLEQIEDPLKLSNKERVLHKRFTCIMTDYRECSDCHSKFESEDSSLAIILNIASQNLHDALAEIAKKEILEGDNAYHCEFCNEKKIGFKSSYIKHLPPNLVFQLKRFRYDFDSRCSQKYTGPFRFPLVVDMYPYTLDAVNANEHEKKKHMYELTGVIVHQGEMSSGHYFSFAKDKKNKDNDIWYKMNDDVVEMFKMNEEFLEKECYGETPKSDVRWSAYLLFYEPIPELEPMSPRKKLTNTSSPLPKDRLSQLSELVDKGEEEGLFSEDIPNNIIERVTDDNLNFTFNKDIYCSMYYQFINTLIEDQVMLNSSYPEETYEALMHLLIHFLFNTLMRYKPIYCDDNNLSWVNHASSIMQRSLPATEKLLQHLNTNNLYSQFLIESPNNNVRYIFCQLVTRAIDQLVYYGQQNNLIMKDTIINLIKLLESSVTRYYLNSEYYFNLMNYLADKSNIFTESLYEEGFFFKLLSFFYQSLTLDDEEDIKKDYPRKWKVTLTSNFPSFFSTMASMLLAVDTSRYYTCEPFNDITIPNNKIPMPAIIDQYIFRGKSLKFIKELIRFYFEHQHGNSFTLLLLYYCYCNKYMTLKILSVIMVGVTKKVRRWIQQTPPNYLAQTQLSQYYSLLIKILGIEDPLQQDRIKWVINGLDDEYCQEILGSPCTGILEHIKVYSVIDNTQTFRAIRFLVDLCQECPGAKDYLISSSQDWNWAVIWLQTKIDSDPSLGLTVYSDSNHYTHMKNVQSTLAEATAILSESQKPTEEEEEESPESASLIEEDEEEIINIVPLTYEEPTTEEKSQDEKIDE